ncbi:MAG: hypothetical protein KF724_05970 [Phycisphaeraceae bacterium]|nr:hypothetical protein [Phycisphaeraceae bacterium]
MALRRMPKIAGASDGEPLDPAEAKCAGVCSDPIECLLDERRREYGAAGASALPVERSSHTGLASAPIT